jgi:radical SAM protein with 4Fe4S-binding SPASM domain
MSLEIVDKVIKDTLGRYVGCFVFADMGEPLMNPHFKEIVLRIRAAHPESKLILGSNFLLMDKNMADFVAENFSHPIIPPSITIVGGMNDIVGLNIDGVTDEGYFAVKRLPLSVVLGNLVYFIKVREEKKSLCQIHVSITTEPRYYLELGEPEKSTVKDETRAIASLMRGLLRVGMGDEVNSSITATWAERNRWNKPKSNFIPTMPTVPNVCMNMFNIGLKCFIDTDGNIIPCCLDYASEKVYGNILTNTIDEIWNGEKRAEFIKLITTVQYDKIGLPCSICQD